MYVHIRKYHFVYHSSPFACVEGCVVYVLALKPVCALVRSGSIHCGPCKVSMHQKTAVYNFYDFYACVMYVHARKCQFVHV